MTIRAYYQRILEVFQQCAKASVYRHSEPQVQIKRVEARRNDKRVKFFLSEPLRLTGDIRKGSPLAKKLNIREGQVEIWISPQETVDDNGEWKTTRSTVEIAYVLKRESEQRPKLLLGIHYDFEYEDSGDPKPAHPLFHAQLTSNLFNLSSRLREDNVLTERMDGMPPLRMPTAHMSFVSVLLHTAADLFDRDQFLTFLKEVRGKDPFPYMENDRFKTRLDANKTGMRSCVWYPNLA